MLFTLAFHAFQAAHVFAEKGHIAFRTAEGRHDKPIRYTLANHMENDRLHGFASGFFSIPSGSESEYTTGFAGS